MLEKEKLNKLAVGDIIILSTDVSGYPYQSGKLKKEFKVAAFNLKTNDCLIKIEDDSKWAWTIGSKSNLDDWIRSGYNLDASIDLNQKLFAISNNSILEIKPKGLVANLMASSFITMVKDDAEDAAYRIVAAQLSNAAKSAILMALKTQGTKKSQINTITKMLDSEVGTAFISLLMGVALTYAPGISEHKRAAALAEEFRISGMVVAGNVISDVATSVLLPALMQTISSLPQEEIMESLSSSREEESSDELEEEVEDERRSARR